jgi:hypothetical protein
MRGEDAQGLLRQADARLYDAKQAGRDRIAIVAGPGGDSLTSPAVPAARG